MSNTATVAPAFKNAMLAAAHTLWDQTEPDVQITFGHPGVQLNDDIVAFGKVTSDQEVAALGPTRPREETLTLEVLFSIYRVGGPEQEQICSDRGYELLGQLENYVRAIDTTVGGTVRDCFLTGHESDGASDPLVIAKGRAIEILATFTAHARIRS
jgi:hypothetical protein